MSECIHGLGPVECCTICNGRDRSAARADDIARRTVSHQWGALYPGSCVVCREEFVVNEAIGRNADGGYVCSTCAIVESPRQSSAAWHERRLARRRRLHRPQPRPVLRTRLPDHRPRDLRGSCDSGWCFT